MDVTIINAIISIIEKGERIMLAVGFAISSSFLMHLAFDWNKYLCIGIGLMLGAIISWIFKTIQGGLKRRAEKKKPETKLQAILDRVEAEFNFHIKEYSLELSYNKKPEEHAKEFKDFCLQQIENVKKLDLDKLKIESVERNIQEQVYNLQKRMKSLLQVHKYRKARDENGHWMG